MSDVPKRGYTAEVARLHADVELAAQRLRDAIDALTAADIAYTADATYWAGTAPDTVKKAVDRMAKQMYTAHGNTAIPEL